MSAIKDESKINPRGGAAAAVECVLYPRFLRMGVILCFASVLFSRVTLESNRFQRFELFSSMMSRRTNKRVISLLTITCDVCLSLIQLLVDIVVVVAEDDDDDDDTRRT